MMCQGTSHLNLVRNKLFYVKDLLKLQIIDVEQTSLSGIYKY